MCTPRLQGTQLSAVGEVLNSKTLRGIVAVDVSLKYKLPASKHYFLSTQSSARKRSAL